ncbi:PAN2-PAN3 deadenylation complex catalytic subunit PAN2 [Cydia splendana]|uniref:PAN2-PAN3 deadenylation complex catalytic subunit PAN2 n=1 Tax=Cydia splendana TaxID=1100963 RepID=UPI00300CCC1B
MEYHFNDLCMPTDHLLTDPYAAEYTQQYIMPSQEGEYEVRSTILVDGGDRFGVSAVQFDKFEELIWMGNQGGHVTSYYGPAMQKYTSFQVHESEEVRDILTMENGIYALTKTSLRHQIRRGIPKHTHRSRNMTDMQCLYQVNSTKLMMGGHQDKLIDLDLTKLVETVIPIPEEGCAVLRGGGSSLVACGSASGSVSLRDLRSPTTAQHTFRAHSACLSDLDMQGDLLITCGFQSVNGVAVAEPYVIVWDVRRLRGGAATSAAWSCATAAPPLLLHYLPAFSGRAVALSGDGHVTLLHVNASDDNHSVFQVDTQSSLCSVMDVSATSQALVFGDQAGHLHLFSPQHNHEPVFNNFSRATEFADAPPNLPFAGPTDSTFQFSSVPLPALAAGPRWFNELPPAFFRKGYRKPKPIDPEVLNTMKMQGPIGYAPNPRSFKRNQMPYIEDTLEDLFAAKVTENKFTNQPVPKHYQKTDGRYNKQDSETSNKPGLPGLEAILPNSYCNSMLQVLYYTPAVKATLLAHTCAKEFCLSCELGFLFRMLDSSGGAACQAANFLRAFRTVPEAAALGLILPDRQDSQDLQALIQSWNRFILHQMHYEILETRKKEKEMALLANSSPPKIRGSVPAPIVAPSTQVNGYPEEYQYAELEFLGPSTEFEDGEPREDGWHNLSQEEALFGPVEYSVSPDTQLNKVNDELPNQQVDREESDISQLFAIGRHQLNRCLKCNKEVILCGKCILPHIVYIYQVSLDSQISEDELPNQQVDREESDISELFAIGRHQLNRCLKCNKEEERSSVVLACALQYPMGSASARGFAELVRASLAPRRATPAWCEQCARFTPTQQQGRVIRLPPILAINCGGVTAHEKAYWAKGTPKETPDSTKRGSSGKPCRYGMHCARPGCRFKHPDRPSPSQGSSKSPDSHCVLPHQLLIRLQSDGDVIINDKVRLYKCSDRVRPKVHKHKKKQVTTISEEEYNLSAAVICVEDNPKNLVAYVQIGEEWNMFNDVSITPVSASEVVQFSAWWKTPCVLFYSSASLKQEES